jgi:hypothetical protein
MFFYITNKKINTNVWFTKTNNQNKKGRSILLSNYTIINKINRGRVSGKNDSWQVIKKIYV